MRCSDAKRRINERTKKLDSETVEHIQTCPSCNRAARAAVDLEGIFSKAREGVVVPDLSILRTRVESAAAEQTRWRIIMLNTKDQYRARPALFTGAVMALVVFLFITLVPFSYNQTVGYSATVSGVKTGSETAPELLTAAMKAIGYEDINVSVSGSESTSEFVIERFPNASEAQEVATALVALATKCVDTVVPDTITRDKEHLRIRAANDERVKVVVKPIIEVAAAPLYAQVVKRVKPAEPQPVRVRFVDGEFIINGEAFNSILTSTDKTDADVRAEILDMLVNTGLKEGDMKVFVETDSVRNYRIVRLVQPGADTTCCSDMSMRLNPEKELRELFVRYGGNERGNAPDSAIEVETRGKRMTGGNLTIMVWLPPDETKSDVD